MTTIVYTYSKCSTCRKATGWLRENGIAFEERPIREGPPTPQELRWMRAQLGHTRRLFNTSGMDYRALGLSRKLDEMSDDEAYALLGGNGMLVKRPFLITAKGGAVGFREKRWEELLD